MEEKIVTERRGHVLSMGLNRPDKYNAFDTDMYHGLARAYAELERDPELRSGLLYAAGDNFTSGLDLPEWAPAFGQGRMPELPEDELDEELPIGGAFCATRSLHKVGHVGRISVAGSVRWLSSLSSTGMAGR